MSFPLHIFKIFRWNISHFLQHADGGFSDPAWIADLFLNVVLENEWNMNKPVGQSRTVSPPYERIAVPNDLFSFPRSTYCPPFWQSDVSTQIIIRRNCLKNNFSRESLQDLLAEQPRCCLPPFVVSLKRTNPHRKFCLTLFSCYTIVPL